MKHKHTPGPWMIDENENYGTEKVRVNNGLTIAVTDHRTDLYDLDFAHESEANARLIASCPEMLAFVEMVLNDQLSHGDFGDRTYISAALNIIEKLKAEES